MWTRKKTESTFGFQPLWLKSVTGGPWASHSIPLDLTGLEGRRIGGQSQKAFPGSGILLFSGRWLCSWVCPFTPWHTTLSLMGLSNQSLKLVLPTSSLAPETSLWWAVTSLWSGVARGLMSAVRLPITVNQWLKVRPKKVTRPSRNKTNKYPPGREEKLGPLHRCS